MLMNQHFLEFETEILKVQTKIQELIKIRDNQDIDDKSLDIEKALEKLELDKAKATRLVYRNLSAWQKTQVARHQYRPQAKAYIEHLIQDFIPLSGDKLFAEDQAIIAGIGRFNGKAVFVVGIEKGQDTKSRVKHNFGMPKPEGYRKAKRIFELASHFNLPVINFIDTPGAFPGIEAERRGQGEAIARCIEVSMNVKSPMISIITGEGGSGGALALATANSVLMLEHSIYSIISPEGCASILWRDSSKANLAAENLGLTAEKLKELNVIDGIIQEPVGGAHRDVELTMKRVEKAIQEELTKLSSVTDLVSHRRDRFLNI
jgi:acetyl-CoA carboxylase carboxyl transferase subunit alpha